MIVDLIDLRHDSHAAGDAEQIDDREVFARLRHDAVVCGNDEDDEVHTRRAGQHCAHEFFVARHVDEAEGLPVCSTLISKTEVDRNAALFLFRQSIRVDARQSLDDGRFSMIDMPGRRDNHRSQLTQRRRSKVRLLTRNAATVVLATSGPILLRRPAIREMPSCPTP